MSLKITGYILFICVFILQSTFTYAYNYIHEKKKIFYLNSYDITFHSFESAKKALDETFPKAEYIIDIDFMDSKRFDAESLNNNLKERIQIKLKERKGYDIVLASDDNALHFVLENYNECFTNTPIVFWGLDDKEKARELDHNKFITGITESVLISETVDMIQTIQPEVDEVIALVDDTETGLINFEIFQSIKERSQGLKLSEIFTNETTTQELADTIKKLSRNKAILRISAYRFKDANLNIYEQTELFFKNSPVPVYCLGTSDIYFGFAGGYLNDRYKQDRLACKMAKDILNGMSVSEMKVIFDMPGKKMLNYPILKKYGLLHRNLPEGAEIINAPSKKLNIRKDLFFTIIVSLFSAVVLLSINVILVISKRKLADKLKISQKNYEMLFRESPSVNLLIDPLTGNIADANNAALHFYGYSIDEIKKKNINDINTLPPTDIYKKMELVPKGVARSFVFAHRKKNGTIRDVEVFTGLLNLNDHMFLHSIVVDITERLRAEREIIEAKQKAEESDNLKSAFLANMSHEIRTPMNSILGFSDLLMNDGISGQQKEFLKMIHSNGSHLLNLINDIIDISKIEANQLKIIKTETTINGLLDELFMDFNRKRINEKSKFELELKKGSQNPNYQIITDRMRLKQILINLLSNAFKFTDKGLIQFGYKVRDDGMLQFFVKDTGIGIPADKHEFIFSVFQRLEDSYTKNYSGAGLGLSITKSLVEKLGGHIWLMSEEGKGSRFYFTIPGAEEKLKI